jgi:hypothetical protein
LYLQSIVADLATVKQFLGDLDEAEYYSRSALDTLRALGDCDADPRAGERLCKAILAVADVLGAKIKLIEVDSFGQPVIPVESSIFLEAESLYIEAITFLRYARNHYYCSLVDIGIPLFELNNIYSRRQCAETAAEESYKWELRILKKKKLCPLHIVATRSVSLVKLYCRKIHNCYQHTHQLFLEGSYKSLLLTARLAALEAIAATIEVTDAAIATPAAVDASQSHLSLSYIAEVYMKALARSGKLELFIITTASRKCLGGSLVTPRGGFGVDSSDGVFGEWLTVPDEILQRFQEWIRLRCENTDCGTAGEGSGNCNDPNRGDDRTPHCRQSRLATSSGQSLTDADARRNSKGNQNRDDNTMIGRCKCLLETSLLLCLGETFASIYYEGVLGSREQRGFHLEGVHTSDRVGSESVSGPSGHVNTGTRERDGSRAAGGTTGTTAEEMAKETNRGKLRGVAIETATRTSPQDASTAAHVKSRMPLLTLEQTGIVKISTSLLFQARENVRKLNAGRLQQSIYAQFFNARIQVALDKHLGGVVVDDSR